MSSPFSPAPLPPTPPAPLSVGLSSADLASMSPDADLIALSRELLRSAIRLHRCDAGLLPLSDEEYEREGERLAEGGQVIMQLHPVTMEGLVAKAQLVRVQFERLVACDYLPGSEHGGETHERLAWSVLNDLLEMTGTLDGMPTFNRGIAVK